MFKPSKRLIVSSIAIVCGAAVVGCEVRVYGPPPPPPPPQPEVAVDAGGVAIDVLPPPDQRVYVYDVGYPPGCYVWGGYYYYNGYRYSHDVFVNRIVRDNIREHRFVDVRDNQRRGATFRDQQRAQYSRNGGHVAHPDVRHDDHHH